MIEELLNYLESLCVAHVDFRHNPATNPAYFEFDYVGMMGRKLRNRTILYVHKIQGRYNDNKGDYQSDTCFLIFHIVQQLPSKDLSQSRTQMLACKAYGEQFLARMERDAKESIDAALCRLLRHIQIGEATYEQIELTHDGWAGVQFRLPFRTKLDLTYNPDLWQ